MNFAVVHSTALDALAATDVTVEVHLANGLPSFTLVGLADTEVKESRERVRAAIQNSGLVFPNNKRITVNLAPADVPKASGRFDLPIALGILAASGQVDGAAMADRAYAGELSLAGDLRPIGGAIAVALAARRAASGRRLVLPEASASEAARVPGPRPLAARHLLDVVASLQPGDAAQPLPEAPVPQTAPAAAPLELGDVRGQTAAKRALEVAAAGAHSLLLVGPPGTGKSMLAHRLSSLLPPMVEEEALESAALLSLAGAFDASCWARRPVRAPHHSASPVALVGGGSPPRPGEISLAHHGVLFLDELPEFPRAALEALREPLEAGRITISRAARRAEFPARFQLVAAMNPCPCGHLGSGLRACRCTPESVARYQARISGPLLDRIDLQVEVPAVPTETLAASSAGESSACVAARVAAARLRAVRRQGCPNAALTAAEVEQHAVADAGATRLLQHAARTLGLSARSFHRLLRIARTVADLDGAADAGIGLAHMGEAIQYRRALLAN